MKEKMIKTSLTLDVVCKVMEKLLMVGIAGIVLGAAALLVTKGFADTNGAVKVSFGALSVVLKNGIEVPGLTTTKIALSSMLTGALQIAIFYAVIKNVRRILAPMKEGRPFEKGTSGRIKNLAFLYLASFASEIIGDAISSLIMNKVLSSTEIFNMSVVNSFSTGTSVNLSHLIVFFVIMLLSYVFRYGEQLQTESDETL